jgi:DNA processing protein
LVSEFPPDALANSWHFPERNRIISGLSHGVLVVEAAEQSGSLITARLGAEQGREVFAIPGSINNPLARGCHRLLRQGAHLVESVDDIVAELPALVAWERDIAEQAEILANTRSRARLTVQDKALLAHIGYDPVPLDVLVARSGQPVTLLLPQLTALELQGRIELRPQGYVLCSKR